MIMKKYIFTALIFFFLSTPNMVGAQTLGGGSLTLSLTPTFPGPNQNVTAVVNSFSINIDSATVSWFLDGQLQERGRGLKKHSFKTGGVGETNTLRVVATDGISTLETERSILVSDVDIVWEAETYKPVWYKGKSLFTPEALLKIVAIPHTSPSGVSDSSSLIFTWERNNRVLGSMSGRGQNVLELETGPLDESLDISVTITNNQGVILAKKRVVIPRTNTDLLVYVDSPLLGIMTNNSVREAFNMEGSEITFRPVPFYFPVEHPMVPYLDYRWSLNGNLVETPGNEVTFKQTGQSGRGSVSLRLEQSGNILNSASRSFDIIFGQ